VQATLSNAKLGGASVVVCVSPILYMVYVLCLPTAVRFFAPPALQVDDSYFLLVSYSWLNGLGFDNYWANPIGTGIFNWHGFLQPMLVAELSPCHSLRCVNTGLIVLGIFWFAIWYVAVNAITKARYLRWAFYIIGVSLVIKYSARPELLASLELVLVVLLFNFFATSRGYLVRAILSGVGVAITLLTSPFTGAFAGFGVAAAITFFRRKDENYLGFALEGIVSLISALAALLFIFATVYPYTPTAWIDGIYLHAIRDMNREDSVGLIKYYFLTKGLPLVGILLITLGGTAFLVFAEMRRTGGLFFLALFCLVSAAFAYLLYFSAMRIPLTYYNFTALVPALILIATLCVSNLPTAGRYDKPAIMGPVIAFSAICVLSQLVWTTQWLSERVDHRRLSEGIVAAVDQYLAANRRIAMDGSLIGAVDDVEKLKKIKVLIFGEKNKLNYDPPDVDVLIRAQNEFGLGVLAQKMPGFRLATDQFDHSELASLLSPEESYYAIYERTTR
jgi:hypothetical protein